MKKLGARLRRSLALRVEQACRTKVVSMKELAHRARFDVRTIRNFLNGKPVKEETIRAICAAVDVEFNLEREGRKLASKSSDANHGMYSESFVSSYIGHFFAYRRSFSIKQNIVRSLFKLEWDDARECLRFKEFQTYHSFHLSRRVSYDQEGDVFLSNAIGLIHLLTVQLGAVRLITLTRLHHEENFMRGVVLTQSEWPDHFQPSVSPTYFRKILQDSQLNKLLEMVGPIEPADADYAEANRILSQTEQGVVNFAKPI